MKDTLTKWYRKTQILCACYCEIDIHADLYDIQYNAPNQILLLDFNLTFENILCSCLCSCLFLGKKAASNRKSCLISNIPLKLCFLLLLHFVLHFWSPQKDTQRLSCLCMESVALKPPPTQVPTPKDEWWEWCVCCKCQVKMAQLKASKNFSTKPLVVGN